MKKFKSLKLMLLGVLAMGSMNAFAQELTNGTLKWTVVDESKKTCEITGLASGVTADAVTIPNKVKNTANNVEYTVVRIKENGSWGGVKSIDLQAAGVKVITAKTFNLSSLESIKLGSGVEEIATGAFSKTKIASLDLSNTSVKTINNLFDSYLEHTTDVVYYDADSAYEKNLEDAKKKGDYKSTESVKTKAKFTEETAAEWNRNPNNNPGAIKAGDDLKYSKATANAYNKATYGTTYTWIKTSEDNFVYTAEYAAEKNAELTGAFAAGDVLDDQTARLYNDWVEANVTGTKLEEAFAIYTRGLYGARPADANLTANVQFENSGEAYDYTYALYYKGNESKFTQSAVYSPAEAEKFNKDNKAAIDAGTKAAAVAGVTEKPNVRFKDAAEATAWNTAHPDGPTYSANDLKPGYELTLTSANSKNKTAFGAGAAENGEVKIYKAQADADTYNKNLKENKYPSFDASDLTLLDTKNFIREVLEKKEGDKLTEVDVNAYNATLPGAIHFDGTAWKDELGNTSPMEEDGVTPVKFTDEEAYAYNMEQAAALNIGFLAKDGQKTGYKATTATADEYNATLPTAVKVGDDDPAHDVKYTKAEANEYNTGKLGPGNFVSPGDVKTKAGKVAAKAFSYLTEVKLPKTAWTLINTMTKEGVTRSFGAFENCDKLATVDFGGNDGETEQQINSNAFLGTAVKAIDLSKTKVKDIPATIVIDQSLVTINKKLESVTINTEITKIRPSTFENCQALKSFNFPTEEDYEKAEEAEVIPALPFTLTIGAKAFANTALESFTLPVCVDATTSSTSTVAASAFSGCGKLKAFTFLTDESDPTVIVDNEAFPGCKDVTFYTTNTYVAAAGGKAPKNCKFNISSPDDYVTPFFPTEYKKVSGKFYIKYHATQDIKVKKDEAKVYNAYIDWDGSDGDMTLNMCLYKAIGGYYNITAGADVLIITNKKDLEYAEGTGLTSGSWLDYESEDLVPSPLVPYVDATINALKIVLNKDGMTLGELDALAGPNRVVYGWVNSATAGTGWQKITTATGKDGKFPAGSMYILAAEPSKDARLNVRWLDENGNLDAEATGIKNINAEDVDSEAIFNLQGVRVNGAQKGIFIQNGKKYVK